MRRILVCTGILGGGTALVFALAALTAVAVPQGTRVAAGWTGGVIMRDVEVMANRGGRDVFVSEAGGWSPASGAVEVP